MFKFIQLQNKVKIKIKKKKVLKLLKERKSVVLVNILTEMLLNLM